MSCYIRTNHCQWRSNMFHAFAWTHGMYIPYTSDFHIYLPITDCHNRFATLAVPAPIQHAIKLLQLYSIFWELITHNTPHLWIPAAESQSLYSFIPTICVCLVYTLDIHVQIYLKVISLHLPREYIFSLITCITNYLLHQHCWRALYSWSHQQTISGPSWLYYTVAHGSDLSQMTKLWLLHLVQS